MRIIKIFAVPSHQTKDRTSGVDFARVIQPMTHLNGYEDENVRFKVDMYDIHAKEQPNWLEIARRHDIVFLNYTVLDWQYAAMGTCVHGLNKKLVMDIDDAIWYVRKDNVVHDEIHKLDGPYKLTCMLNDVDMVSCTNRYLRNVIMDKTTKYPDKIKIIPNFIDLSLYNHISKPNDNYKITLLHYGSTSHFDDLLDKEFIEGIDRIMKEYPQVKFKAVGSFISDLKNKWGERYENDFGDVDIYKWIKNKFPSFMDEADIIIAPLNDVIYNRCKSDIKAIEVWSAAKPIIASNTRPYSDIIIQGVNGYVCSSAEDWYNYLKDLIHNKEKRLKMGLDGYNYVVKERQMKNKVKLYADMFKKVVEK